MSEPDLSHLDEFFAECRAQNARWNERERPAPRLPGQPGFDPRLTNVRVGDGPLPCSWEDGNGNVHFDLKALHDRLGLPHTIEERDDTMAMLAALLAGRPGVAGIALRPVAPRPVTHN